MNPIYIFLIWAAAVVILFFFSYKMRSSRKGKIKSMAYRRGSVQGWQFLEKSDAPDVLFAKTGFDFFNKNENRHSENFITGINNSYAKMTYFEYSHDELEPSSQTGVDSFHTFYFSCVLAELKTGLMPDFALEPETLLTKAGEQLGVFQKDIDFEESPEFSDNYYLYGKDENAIRNFFNMNILNAFAKNKGFHVCTSGRHILVFTQRAGADKVYDFIEKAEDLVSIIGLEAKKRF